MCEKEKDVLGIGGQGLREMFVEEGGVRAGCPFCNTLNSNVTSDSGNESP
jgi:redox-regulated HSP33 family molecular chaperone